MGDELIHVDSHEEDERLSSRLPRMRIKGKKKNHTYTFRLIPSHLQAEHNYVHTIYDIFLHILLHTV